MDTVLNWVWQGCVVALALHVALRCLGRSHANSRYVVCWAGLLLIVFLPVIPRMSGASLDSLPAAAQSVVVTVPDAWWTSSAVMLAAWLVWAGLNAARLLRAIVMLRRARASGRPFPHQVESQLPHWSRVRNQGRRPALILSDAVTTAAVLGGGSPIIAVAPALVARLEAGELDRVLIHEWAHVQRRDDLAHVLQFIVRIVVGWHPAVWWIEHRLQVEREIACDERAIAVAGSPRSYAECLVKLAGLRDTGRTPLAAPAMRPGRDLRDRVIRIVSRRALIAPLWSRSIATVVVWGMCLVAVGAGGLTLVESSVLALPLEPFRAARAGVERIAVLAAPGVHADPRPTSVSRRAVSPAASIRRSRTQTMPASTPPAESSQPAAVEREPTILVGGSAIPVDATQSPHDMSTTEPARSPWSQIADRGTAVGQKSKDAGLSTGRAFTRFGRRIAGAF
jgi:beta-lactamase regulating signal transducer with metallopeptidase domain